MGQKKGGRGRGGGRQHFVTSADDLEKRNEKQEAYSKVLRSEIEKNSFAFWKFGRRVSTRFHVWRSPPLAGARRASRHWRW